MRFVPNYTLDIINDKDFPKAIKEIKERLEPCLNSGFFDTGDSKKIYYEYFLAESSKASIVIVHGLSEFTKKFYEIAFYFLNQSYNVFIYDQRCHGFSSRLTDKMDLLHVDSYKDYVSDLNDFIDKIVIPADNKPLYIYAHSMGGAVSALYLAQNPDKIKKAVLSSPMFEPKVGGVSHRTARWSTGLASKLLGKKRKFYFSREFNPNIARNKKVDASENRFLYNMELRRNEPHYRSTPMTYGWVHESLLLRATLLKQKFIDKIKTPILILSSANDTVVENEPQFIFAEKCPVCEIVSIENTNHSMLTAKQEIIVEHINKTLEFFSS